MNTKMYWWTGLSLLVLVVFGLFPHVSWLEVGFVDALTVVKAAKGPAGKTVVEALELTFWRFGSAGVVGCIFGVLIGTLRAFLPTVRHLTNPWMDVSRITPAIVWIPVLFLFKIGSENIPFCLGALYASLYMSLDVEARLREISDDERTYLAAQNFTLYERFRFSYVSRLLAGLSSGARLGLSIALILVVVGEALVGVSGLGQLITEYQQSLAVDELWLTIVMLSALALLSFYFATKLSELSGAE